MRRGCLAPKGHKGGEGEGVWVFVLHLHNNNDHYTHIQHPNKGAKHTHKGQNPDHLQGCFIWHLQGVGNIGKM